MNRMSRTVTLKLLTGLTLTGCLAASGCGAAEGPAPGRDAHEPIDTTWYDENGNAIPERWETDENGNRVLDGEGRPVPVPRVPHDRHGRPWVYHNSAWVPLVVIGHTGYHSGPVRSSSWVTGGSGYRSTNTVTSYRAPTGAGSRPVLTGAPARSSPPAGSSISRSGFGSTGSASPSAS
ncbi:MAG TPA: hypothetical protein VGE74_03085 [Gemmata sp.]